MKSRIGRRVDQWLTDQRAATSVEYGLLMGLIALAIISAITAVGNPTQNHFNAAVNAWPE